MPSVVELVGRIRPHDLLQRQHLRLAVAGGQPQCIAGVFAVELIDFGVDAGTLGADLGTVAAKVRSAAAYSGESGRSPILAVSPRCGFQLAAAQPAEFVTFQLHPLLPAAAHLGVVL